MRSIHANEEEDDKGGRGRGGGHAVERSHHLGYAPGAAKPEGGSNHRNGACAKTVLTGGGPLRIEVPRDREGGFEPLLIAKHERRFSGFDDKIVVAMRPPCPASVEMRASVGRSAAAEPRPSRPAVRSGIRWRRTGPCAARS
jgi:hypothetical protein